MNDRRTILIDTGPIVALFDESESLHEQTRDYIKEYDGRLLTTFSVITESFWLLKQLSDAAPNLLEWVHRGGLEVCSFERSHFRRLRSLTVQYDDVPWTLRMPHWLPWRSKNKPPTSSPSMMISTSSESKENNRLNGFRTHSEINPLHL